MQFNKPVMSMEFFSRAGVPAAILALLGMPAAAHAQLDIAVTSISVQEGQSSGELEFGQPGKQYVIGCSYTKYGGGASSIEFRLLVNGYVVQEIDTPTIYPAPLGVATMSWIPVVPANYELSCEANPDKAIAETVYTNNKQSMQFAVLDPTVATKGKDVDAAPSPAGRVSAKIRTETGPRRMTPTPRGEGEEKIEDESIIVCPECFNPQPEPPGKIVEEEEPRFHPDPPPPAPEPQ
ncbi:MAG TPA: hypothetical protein VFP98_05395 [Candidatus Polarisedimenticolia bacterium]|nr:hypothetical protein [Candidatus Polarisedimenticolia bacterium]